MGLDLRFPIGMMFSLLGAILALYGFFTGGDVALYQSSLGYNVNLAWGVVLLLFGATMWIFAWRGKSPRG
jgi:hypothetical protein